MRPQKGLWVNGRPGQCWFPITPTLTGTLSKIFHISCRTVFEPSRLVFQLYWLGLEFNTCLSEEQHLWVPPKQKWNRHLESSLVLLFLIAAEPRMSSRVHTHFNFLISHLSWRVEKSKTQQYDHCLNFLHCCDETHLKTRWGCWNTRRHLQSLRLLYYQ